MKKRMHITVLAGKLMSGKTTYADGLYSQIPSLVHIEVSTIVKSIIGGHASRKELQDTKHLTERIYKLIKDLIVKASETENDNVEVLITGPREVDLLKRLRAEFDSLHYFTWIWLSTNEDVRQKRYLQRKISEEPTLKYGSILKKFQQDNLRDVLLGIEDVREFIYLRNLYQK